MRTMTLAAALLAAAMTLGFAGITAGAQSNDTIMRVTAPAGDSAIKEGDVAPFDVSVENVENLGAFSFVMQFDPDVFEFEAFQRGDFLGSSGREVVCEEPLADVGSVRISCITLREQPEGATGSGLLGTVELNASGSGTTEITLNRGQLIVPDGTTEIPMKVENTSVEVESTSSINWLIWGVIIGIAVIAIVAIVGFVATRMRSSASKQAPAT